MFVCSSVWPLLMVCRARQRLFRPSSLPFSLPSFRLSARKSHRLRRSPRAKSHLSHLGKKESTCSFLPHFRPTGGDKSAGHHRWPRSSAYSVLKAPSRHQWRAGPNGPLNAIPLSPYPRRRYGRAHQPITLASLGAGGEGMSRVVKS